MSTLFQFGSDPIPESATMFRFSTAVGLSCTTIKVRDD